MQPGDRKPIPTVSEAVSRAAVLCDPEGDDGVVTTLIRVFEDDDRPTTAVEELDEELRTSVEGVDPEGDSAPAQVTAAAALWLATNMDAADDRERVLRESVRLGFGEEPPEHVRLWLEAEGLPPA